MECSPLENGLCFWCCRYRVTPAEFQLGVHSVTNILSPRLRQVLSLARDGHTAIEIAFILGLSYRTVNQYLSDCYKRLGARNRIMAVRIAIARGEIDPMMANGPEASTRASPGDDGDEAVKLENLTDPSRSPPL